MGLTGEFATDVLICGAGAAGLTLAIELARRGVAFALIDGAAEPFHGSRGKGIQPRSLEVFEDLGVVDRLLDGLGRAAWHRWNDGTPQSMSLCPLMGTDQFQLQARIPGDGEVDLSAAGLEAMIAERTRRRDLRVHAVSWASAYSMNARLA